MFKLHPLVKGVLDGGERVAWGAKALPGGGYWSMPKLSMPGALLVGDAGGMVDTAALKGVHHCIKSGALAAEAIYRNLKNGESLESYETAVDESSIGTELYQVRNARQAFQKGFLVGSLFRRSPPPAASAPVTSAPLFRARADLGKSNPAPVPPIVPIVRAPDDPGIDEEPVSDEFAEPINPPQGQAGGWRGFLARWGG